MKCYRPVFAASSTLLLTACAELPQDAGFGEVSELMASRSGLTVRWDQGTEVDREMDREVRDLLSRPLSADDAVQVALLRNRRMQAVY